MPLRGACNSLEQLETTRHEHELAEDSSSVHLHLDVAHMGVGGDDRYNAASVHVACHLSIPAEKTNDTMLVVSDSLTLPSRVV